MTSNLTTRKIGAGVLAGVLVLHAGAELLAQARTARRGAAVKTEEGGAAVGRRGAAVKTEDGAAAVTRRGAAVKTEEGVKTVPRYGAPVPRGGVVVGEEAAAAVGRRGAVVVGEEGAAAGVAAGIAIGTMLRKPPKQAVPVVVSTTTYYYDSGTYYAKAMSSGEVVYQVVPAPAGAIIVTLPAGCSAVNVGGVTYSKCGATHYRRVSTGYHVVVLS